MTTINVSRRTRQGFGLRFRISTKQLFHYVLRAYAAGFVSALILVATMYYFL